MGTVLLSCLAPNRLRRVSINMNATKNVVVIYKSKYGSTKQYAQWIAEELNTSLFEATSIDPSQLMGWLLARYLSDMLYCSWRC